MVDKNVNLPIHECNHRFFTHILRGSSADLVRGPAMNFFRWRMQPSLLWQFDMSECFAHPLIEYPITMRLWLIFFFHIPTRLLYFLWSSLWLEPTSHASHTSQAGNAPKSVVCAPWDSEIRASPICSASYHLPRFSESFYCPEDLIRFVISLFGIIYWKNETCRIIYCRYI